MSEWFILGLVAIVAVVAMVITVVAIVFGRGLTFKATQAGDVTFVLDADEPKIER